MRSIHARRLPPTSQTCILPALAGIVIRFQTTHSDSAFMNFKDREGHVSDFVDNDPIGPKRDTMVTEPCSRCLPSTNEKMRN